MYGRVHGYEGGFPLGALCASVVIALLIAATIIAIVMMIQAAKKRGIPIAGGRLAGCWFMGICLTPVTLGVYLLILGQRQEELQAAFASGGNPQAFTEPLYETPHVQEFVVEDMGRRGGEAAPDLQGSVKASVSPHDPTVEIGSKS